jgi:hypothetical protein
MTGPPAAAGDSKRATLSRELSEFLIELSIALHKHAMYPPDHPSLAPAVSGVARRAELLMQDRPSISLGVARDQLVIEGVATDSKHPVLSDLARRLHRHHLGAVTFYNGINAAEISDLLLTLAADAEREGQPLGLGPQAQMQAWKHARLHPLAFERLELLEDFPDEPRLADSKGDEVAGGQRVRGAQLWLGLARAAMAGQISDDEAPPLQPSAVAKAIDDHPSGDAYDQVIVGYLLQIADELRTAGGDGAVELRRRTSILVRKLRPETLQRLVQMGGDSAQRRRFVADAADGMAVDAVVEILKAAAESSHQQISHSLVRLLSKMAAHAEHGVVRGRPVADRGLREQVHRLLSDWELKDPNPGAYGAALERISRANPLFATTRTAEYMAGDEQIVQTGVEIGVTGPRIELAMDRLEAGGKIGAMLDLLERAPDGPVASSLRRRVTNIEQVAAVLASDPLDLPLLDRLLLLVGAPAGETLLEALVGAESRSTRRQLISRLKQFGHDMLPALVARLADERWYVVRNVLLLVDELPQLPAGFSARSCTAHPDPRVRRLALRLQMKLADERVNALGAALGDSDPEIVRLGLLGVQQEIPVALGQAVASLAVDRTVDSELRVLAIRALSRSGEAVAAMALIGIVDGGRSFFGRQRLAAKSAEVLAALRSLANRPSQPEVAGLIALAAKSQDPEIRDAVSRPINS